MTFRFEMIKLQSFETRRALVRLKFFQVVKCVAILKIPIESRHIGPTRVRASRIVGKLGKRQNRAAVS